ncbi:MAG: anti-sigma factor [Haliscomenobacter sp.]|nr:anti-sigma factor [Haliscomenobacter sp.]
MWDKKRVAGSGLIHEYVLGLTSEEENEEMEMLLQKDLALQREVTALKQNLLHYAKTHTPLVPASAGAEIRRAKPKARYASLALLAIVASMLVFFYAVWTRQSSQLRSLRQELASCEENQDNSRAVAQLFSQIAPKGTLPVTLQGTQLAPGSRSVVFWNPTKKTAWLNPGGLPAPPPGHQYQVWADVDGEMIPLGLIQPDGGDLHQIQYVSQAASLNITIEPLGGSDHPTVSKLMASGII